MPISVKVKCDDELVKAERELLAQRVIDAFACLSPNARLLCFLDDEDAVSVACDRGPAIRGLHGHINNLGDLDGWPNYVRDVVFPSNAYGTRDQLFDEVIYLFGRTCALQVALVMTLAHELQHSAQYNSSRELMAVNNLVTNLSVNTINSLGLDWKDIPIEVEARIISKQVAETLFGPQRVAEHVDRKIAERITEGDVADWKFIAGLTPSSTVDLEGDTYRLFARLQNYRPELESILRDARTKPEFAAIDLDNYFSSKSRGVSRG